jgi:hypothetical protein
MLINCISICSITEVRKQRIYATVTSSKSLESYLKCLQSRPKVEVYVSASRIYESIFSILGAGKTVEVFFDRLHIIHRYRALYGYAEEARMGMRMEGKEERGKVGWNVGGWNGWMERF